MAFLIAILLVYGVMMIIAHAKDKQKEKSTVKEGILEYRLYWEAWNIYHQEIPLFMQELERQGKIGKHPRYGWYNGKVSIDDSIAKTMAIEIYGRPLWDWAVAKAKESLAQKRIRFAELPHTFPGLYPHSIYYPIWEDAGCCDQASPDAHDWRRYFIELYPERELKSYKEGLWPKDAVEARRLYYRKKYEKINANKNGGE